MSTPPMHALYLRTIAGAGTSMYFFSCFDQRFTGSTGLAPVEVDARVMALLSFHLTTTTFPSSRVYPAYSLCFMVLSLRNRMFLIWFAIIVPVPSMPLFRSSSKRGIVVKYLSKKMRDLSGRVCTSLQTTLGPRPSAVSARGVDFPRYIS